MTLLLAARNNWKVYQIDVKFALNGVLKEEIYAERSPGYEIRAQNNVYRLRNALGGLKQAPKACVYKN